MIEEELYVKIELDNGEIIKTARRDPSKRGFSEMQVKNEYNRIVKCMVNRTIVVLDDVNIWKMMTINPAHIVKVSVVYVQDGEEC